MAKAKTKAVKTRRIKAGSSGFGRFPTETPFEIMRLQPQTDLLHAPLAPPRRKVDGRSPEPWNGDREAWEASFLLTPSALNKFIASYVYPQIPDTCQIHEIAALDVTFEIGGTLTFAMPSIEAIPGALPLMRMTLPIATGQVSVPGYELDLKGAAIVAEFPLGDISFEIRWEDKAKAVVALDFGGKKPNVSYRLSGGPKPGVAPELVAISNAVVNAVIQRVTLDGRVLASVEVPEAAQKYLDMVTDALPSRLYFKPLPAKSGSQTVHSIAAMVVCGGKNTIKDAAPAFTGQEDIGVRASTRLVTNAVLVPSLNSLLREFQKNLPADAIQIDPRKFKIGVKDFAKKPSDGSKFWITLDPLDDLLKRPFIKDNPALLKAIQKVKDLPFSSSLKKIGLSFEVRLEGNVITVAAQLYLEAKVSLIDVAFVMEMKAKYALGFAQTADQTSFVAKPVYLDFNYEIDLLMSIWEKLLVIALLSILLLLVGMLADVIVELLGFWICILLGISVAFFKKQVAKIGELIGKVTGAIHDLRELRRLLDWMHKNPENIDGFVAKANALIDDLKRDKFLDKDFKHISKETLSVDYALPANAEIALLSRMNFSDTADVFATFNPPAPAPRPLPQPKSLVEIYEFVQDFTGRRYYSADPKPLPAYLHAYKTMGAVFFGSREPVKGYEPVHLFKLLDRETRKKVVGYLSWPMCKDPMHVIGILNAFDDACPMTFDKTLFYIGGAPALFAKPLHMFAKQRPLEGGTTYLSTDADAAPGYRAQPDYFYDPTGEKKPPVLYVYPAFRPKPAELAAASKKAAKAKTKAKAR